jgi:hypothetical protein
MIRTILPGGGPMRWSIPSATDGSSHLSTLQIASNAIAVAGSGALWS